MIRYSHSLRDDDILRTQQLKCQHRNVWDFRQCCQVKLTPARTSRKSSSGDREHVTKENGR